MKRLVIEIDETLHKAIRSIAFRQEKSIKQFVTEILKAELEKNNRK